VRVAFDSNVLLYAEGLDGAAQQLQAVGVIDLVRLSQADLVIPVQVLGEVFAVLRRKSGWPPDRVRQSLVDWRAIGAIVPTTEMVLLRAADLAVDHLLAFWDSVIFAAAADANCRVLLSEDMQDGFTWGGVTVINPFHEKGRTILQSLIN
jgi:predicted nucleic acid-binding protein